MINEYEVLVELYTDAINEHNEYLKLRERDITRQELMIAKCMVAVEYAEARQEIAREVMKIFFEERNGLREMLEHNLDKSIERGDVVLADLSLKLLEKVYERNPLDVYKITIRGD